MIHKIVHYIALAAFSLAFAFCIRGAFTQVNERYNQRYNMYLALEKDIKSGYTVYINGTEVEGSKLNIKSYDSDNISINDEEKEIYIAVK